VKTLTYGNQCRISVTRDLRTRMVVVTLDDGVMAEPSDPRVMRTPTVLAQGKGLTLVDAMKSIVEVTL